MGRRSLEFLSLGMEKEGSFRCRPPAWWLLLLFLPIDVAMIFLYRVTSALKYDAYYQCLLLFLCRDFHDALVVSGTEKSVCRCRTSTVVVGVVVLAAKLLALGVRPIIVHSLAQFPPIQGISENSFDLSSDDDDSCARYLCQTAEDEEWNDENKSKE